jgi:hypothetical protein
MPPVLAANPTREIQVAANPKNGRRKIQAKVYIKPASPYMNVVAESRSELVIVGLFL